MNREQIDARIFNHLKYTYSPDYRVTGVRTRWIGQRNGERFYFVRYFLTSTRFIGGVRYDKVSVRDKEVRIVQDE
jgi:hypothetical protein